MDELPDFLKGIFDTATGVFDRIVDLEFGKRELAVLQENLAFKQAQAFQSSTPSTSSGGNGQILMGVSNTTLLIGAGAAIVGLILLTR